MNHKPSVDAKFEDADMADFEEAFELFDKDGDGTISTGELKNLLRCFGKKATEDEVFAILKRFGKIGENESIKFEEFVQIMQEMMTEPEFDDEIVQVYKVFDRDDKGINERELMEVMNKLLELKHIHNTQHGAERDPDAIGLEESDEDQFDQGLDSKGERKAYPQISLEEAKEMIQEADMDGDGRLAFEEFARILMDKTENRAVRNRTDKF